MVHDDTLRASSPEHMTSASGEDREDAAAAFGRPTFKAQEDGERHEQLESKVQKPYIKG